MDLSRRILIPSDNRDFVVNFAEAYARLGHEVTVGCYNFFLESIPADVVHFLWPEEFTGWRVPDEGQLESLVGRLDRWAQRSALIISVNNLYPHRQEKNPFCHRLYEAFYHRARVIHHFSQTSKDLVCQEYPSIAGQNHVVRLGFNYDRLLPTTRTRDRKLSRMALGIKPDEMVY